MCIYGYARIQQFRSSRVVSGQNWPHLVASVKGVELLRIRLRSSRIEPKEPAALAGILGVSIDCHTARPPCGHRQGTAASREQHVRMSACASAVRRFPEGARRYR